MSLEFLQKGLAEAAKDPRAFVAYVVVAVGWLSILWKEARIKNIAKALELLPEKQRLEALKLEYKLIPKKGLSAEQFLKSQKRNFLFLAYIITAIAILVVVTLAYSHSEQRSEVVHGSSQDSDTTEDDNKKSDLQKVLDSIKSGVSKKYIYSILGPAQRELSYTSSLSKTEKWVFPDEAILILVGDKDVEGYCVTIFEQSGLTFRTPVGVLGESTFAELGSEPLTWGVYGHIRYPRYKEEVMLLRGVNGSVAFGGDFGELFDFDDDDDDDDDLMQAPDVYRRKVKPHTVVFSLDSEIYEALKKEFLSYKDYMEDVLENM